MLSRLVLAFGVLALTTFSFVSSALAVQTLSCELKRQLVSRDADEDIVFTYENLSSKSAELRGNTASVVGSDLNNFYYIVVVHPDQTTVYLKDKKTNAALNFTGKFIGTNSWQIAEPGSEEVDQGLKLTCTLTTK